MKGRVLDIMLVVIIAISGGFIGYRLMKRNDVSQPLLRATSLAPSPTDSPTPQATYKPIARARPGYANGPFQALLDMRSFSPTQWANVKKTTPLKDYFVDATDACKNPLARTLRGYPILNEKVLKRLQSGTLEFLVAPAGQICVRKNSIATIISMGDYDEDPVLSLIADVTIEDVIQLPTNQLAKSASTLFDIPAEKVAELLTPATFRTDGNMSLLRISKPRPSQHDKALPSQGFPRYNVLTSERLVSWLRANPGATVLDVRSNKERQQNPILYSGSLVAAPYSVSAKKWQFRWDRTWTDLDKDDFDISQVLKLADTAANARPVLVVGAASFDGRPVWTLLALFSANMGNVAWFYDGAASFNGAISNSK